MKIFDTKTIKAADKITISNQNITSLELMERAAFEAFLWIKSHFPDKETTFHFFCGKGNNGGDGLIVARLLSKDNYPVFVDIIEEAGNPTPEFNAALSALTNSGMGFNTTDPITFKKGKLIYIDAIFGIGFNRGLHPDVVTIIEKINKHDGVKIAIDTPSGLYMDRPTKIAVKSDIVLSFQFPKLAFYLPGNSDFVNRIEILDIGIDKDFVANEVSQHFLADAEFAGSLYVSINRYTHKGTQGHALIIGGSYGKIGAVCLASKAALKAGCGLVTAYLPECGYTIMQSYFPEAMALVSGDRHITNIAYDLNTKAIGLGPGIGQHPETQQAIYDFLEKANVPLVIDADALNIISYNKEWLKLLPEQSILTPHPKELERLIGKWEDDFEMLLRLKEFSKQYNIIVVAKNAHTIIVNSDSVYVNSTGNAALATGGTGDTLTGIITGLLAQGYLPVNAAVFGAYLHGLTADIAVADTGYQAFTASDVIAFLGKAYLHIEAEAKKK